MDFGEHPVKNFGELWTIFFGELKFSIAGISDTSCRITTKFCMVKGLANGHFFPKFGEL